MTVVVNPKLGALMHGILAREIIVADRHDGGVDIRRGNRYLGRLRRRPDFGYTVTVEGVKWRLPLDASNALRLMSQRGRFGATYVASRKDGLAVLLDAVDRRLRSTSDRDMILSWPKGSSP